MTMEKEEKLFSSQRGITLIALIITIIVLLILAGITISLVVGDNGVLNQAKKASIETSKADLEEALGRAVASAEGEYATSPEFNNGSKTFYEWLKGDSGRLKENGYTITLKNKSDGLQGTITKEDKNNGLKFTLKGGETTLDVDVDITGEYNKGEGKTAADLGPEDIGKVVKYEGYEADYDGDWEIFYTDDENIYIISRKLVSGSKVFSSEKLNKYGGTRDFSDEKMLENFPAVKQGWLYKIYSGGEVIKNNYFSCMKIVEYLLDKNEWSQYAESGVADWAIGGPTLELLVASYNQKNPDDQRVIGDLYGVTDATSFFDILDSVLTFSEDTLWNRSDYYLASCSYFTMSHDNYLLCVGSRGLGQATCPSSSIGFRAVVCLNRNVLLKEEAGAYQICE